MSIQNEKIKLEFSLAVSLVSNCLHADVLREGACGDRRSISGCPTGSQLRQGSKDTSLMHHPFKVPEHYTGIFRNRRPDKIAGTPGEGSLLLSCWCLESPSISYHPLRLLLASSFSAQTGQLWRSMCVPISNPGGRHSWWGRGSLTTQLSSGT